MICRFAKTELTLGLRYSRRREYSIRSHALKLVEHRESIGEGGSNVQVLAQHLSYGIIQAVLDIPVHAVGRINALSRK